MKIGVVVFPGSNCDQDCIKAVQNVTRKPVVWLWHKDTSLQNCDAIILPGGFSYGDYLRSGALAKFSPIMKEVVALAKKGHPVLGICNGFQILTEAGLLPGVLMRNSGLSFICETVKVTLQSTQTPFTSNGEKGRGYALPIAHMDGNYQISDEGFKALQDNDQIVFTYEGKAPNGSRAQIAGICNEAKNVMGLMPHPERVCEPELGGTDGRFVFESLVAGF